MNEENNELKKWCNKKKSITLTNRQLNDLSSYILATKDFMKEECKSLEIISKEVNKNGEKLYPTAGSSAIFYNHLYKSIMEINEIID